MNKKTRTQKGTFKAIRSDTKISTIEKRYNINLNVRSDMEIGNYLRTNGFASLSGMLSSSR